ncbi:MAG TPA: cytochrome P450 [Paenalcaligenes sp.]|nr:cytochrome P450 [Paenalcaligenes sp.]
MTTLPQISFLGQDVRSLTDELRKKHRIVQNELGQWVLLHHKDVYQVALDDTRFSSAVSRFLQIPNGLDGKEHDAYRQLIDQYLTPEKIMPFVPEFERIAQTLIADLLKHDQEVDAVHDLGAVFAVRAQCAWLGWPKSLEPRLLKWIHSNHIATASRELKRTEAVAQEFDEIIQLALAETSVDSITQQLHNEKIFERALNHAEIISILRNWTSGDLGSMALCIGVLIAYIAQSKDQESLLKELRAFNDKELELFIDEVLRLDNPFISNRRRATCPVKIGGSEIPEGAQLVLSWTSANRDSTVFSTELFDPKTHAEQNLLYGAGRHVCPGRVLSTWQLRVVMQQLLAQITAVEVVPLAPFERETAPIGGYKRVPVLLRGG